MPEQQGVGAEYADRPEASGVDTVLEATRRKPGNLHAKTAGVSVRKQRARRLPPGPSEDCPPRRIPDGWTVQEPQSPDGSQTSDKVKQMSEDHFNRRVTPAGRIRLAVGLLILGAVVAIQLLRPHNAVGPIPAERPERNEEPAIVAAPPTERSGPREATGPSARTEDAGLLTELPDGSLESPAGLLYERGSAEGHRLDHVLRHADDMPARPIHGVFDGGREEIVAVIDEAWKKTRTRGPPAVITEQEGSRTIHTVDLQRRIGYVGGRSGQRRGHPSARHLKLVLEDRSVITAYPLVP
ncbi:MAG: DUF4332 domain-containing protein [Maioricimonas sp. JB049]